ncbi:MAG TPA: hypothetical protein VF103_16915, partial [Polyangiaceae bacterium]
MTAFHTVNVGSDTWHHVDSIDAQSAKQVVCPLRGRASVARGALFQGVSAIQPHSALRESGTTWHTNRKMLRDSELILDGVQRLHLVFPGDFADAAL